MLRLRPKATGETTALTASERRKSPLFFWGPQAAVAAAGRRLYRLMGNNTQSAVLPIDTRLLHTLK